MKSARSAPTIRLLAGLAITLTAVAVYASFTVRQLRSLEELQSGIIDRNRAVLLEYWDGRIDTAQLIERLK